MHQSEPILRRSFAPIISSHSLSRGKLSSPYLGISLSSAASACVFRLVFFTAAHPSVWEESQLFWVSLSLTPDAEAYFTSRQHQLIFIAFTIITHRFRILCDGAPS